MCGIAGIYSFTNISDTTKKVDDAIRAMHLRGPDFHHVIQRGNATLGHTRLSIIDTSAAANQPFTTQNGVGILIFNGEIFNFRELASKYKISTKLKTSSDTEVLAELLLIEDPVLLLNQLNGFFAFAFYNSNTQKLLIARDRYGVKPLYYYQNSEGFYFASELKGLLPLGLKKEIDFKALNIYLHYNYVPAPFTIFKDSKKLMPGNYLEINALNQLQEIKYYDIELNKGIPFKGDYASAKSELRNLLFQSVKMRLLSDVPLGSFLSGGIDSSIVTAIAAQEVKGLNTFSIGFTDEPFFDETHYALLVAKKYKTNHHVFKLSNNDLYEHLNDMLNYFDEPFADSSALNMYILCKHTKKKATVALSGDGADELFAGYNKHAAEFICRKFSILKPVASLLNPLLRHLPQSRNSAISNKIRQFTKLTEAFVLSNEERYFRLAGYTTLKEKSVLNSDYLYDVEFNKYLEINFNDDLNNIFLADQKLVLEGDMLVKVDRMSMANSLEVREPFLDYRLVNFVNQLPSDFKIDSKKRKKILVDTFSDLLPIEIVNRGKKGFEVPLLKWFNNDLKTLITNNYLNPRFIEEQGIFNPVEVDLLLRKVFSKNPGDSVARVWGLIVFQHWFKRYYV